ncbi:MAG: AAA family ATPase [Silvanigrellaceae bacterium]|nr:AAA family ATPase [Silvanigrellaceae bacterium]
MFKKISISLFLLVFPLSIVAHDEILCDEKTIVKAAQLNYYQMKSKSYPLEIGAYLGATAIYAVYLTLNPPNRNQPQLPNQGGGMVNRFAEHFIGGLGLIFNPMTIAYAGAEKIKEIGGYVYDYAKSSTFGLSEKDSLEKKSFLSLETAYLRFQHCSNDLPKETREFVEELFKTTKENYFINKISSDNELKDIEKILNNIEAILSISNKVKPVTLNGELREKLQNALKTYSKEVNDELFAMASLLADAAECAEQANCKQLKPSVYFLGGPGTGKTTIAKTFAEIIDIGFVEIHLGQAKELHDLIGESDGRGIHTLLSKYINTKSFSLFTQQIKETINKKGKKYKNMIFFLDEIDKVLNSSDPSMYQLKTFFLDLLNPDNKVLKLHDLGIEIDISSCLFILAGNYPLRNEALRNRMQTLYFKPMPLSIRTKIALDHFDFLQKQNIDGDIMIPEKNTNGEVIFCICDSGDYLKLDPFFLFEMCCVQNLRS